MLVAWTFVPFAAFAQGHFELQETNRPIFFVDVTNVYTNTFVNRTNGMTNVVVITNVSQWPAFLTTNFVITNGVTNAIITTNFIEEQTNMLPTPYFPPPAPKPWYKRIWDWFFG